MSDVKSKGSGILTVDERAAIEQLANAEAPNGQRATAFLTLDDGATQAQAAEQAGLTKGQVRYWLDQFRKKGMAIFPEEAVDEEPAVAEEPIGESSPLEQEDAAEPAPDPVAAEPPADAVIETGKKKKKKGKGKGSAKKKNGKKKKGGKKEAPKKKGKKKGADGGKKKASKKKGKNKGKKKSK